MQLTSVDSRVQVRGSPYVPVKNGRQSQVITSAGSKVSDLAPPIGPRICRADLRVK